MNSHRRFSPRSALLACALLSPTWANKGQIALGNGGASDGPRLVDALAPTHRGLHGKFLHITDFHPDEYYKPHTSEDKDCHRGKGDAGIYGTALSGCDSSYPLVDATFDWISANLKDEVDFVVWTGDSARHDSDEATPRTAAEVLRSNQYLVDRMKEVFSDARYPNQLEVPIVPNIGNNDFLPHNILLPGPNKWLTYYADMWRSFIPEEQRHAFEFGGWYSVEVIPDQLAVFSLNTMYFFDRNAGVDDCTTPSEPGYQQMEWLRIQLQRLRERGVKAILIGHVPPAKTASKELWDETCWQKYNLWMRQYRDVVVGSVYGHMNIDHFLLHDTKDINLKLLGGVDAGEHDLDDYEDESEEEALDSEEYEEDEVDDHSFTTSGKGKYLLELRRAWAKLPEVTTLCTGSPHSTSSAVDSAGKKKKGKKGKKKKGSKGLGGTWAERYHLSFVSPSIVPNFLPTLRVIEYNITGLEDAPTWAPVADTNPPSSLDFGEMAELEEEVRHVKAIKKGKKGKKRKGKKKKGKKGKKGKKKEPSLVLPNPPAKHSPPGPAYAPQPLTWTGYTQYFANVTHINDPALSSGKKGNGPGDFQYEVEYDTFSDKLFKLRDMTVRNYVRLAYRIGIAVAKKGKGKSVAEFSVRYDDLLEGWDEEEEGDEEEADNDEEEDEYEDEDGSDEEEGGEVEADNIECQRLKAGNNKNKDKKRKRESEKAWRRFVSYAFVSTGFEEEAIDRFAVPATSDEL